MRYYFYNSAACTRVAIDVNGPESRPPRQTPRRPWIFAVMIAFENRVKSRRPSVGARVYRRVLRDNRPWHSAGPLSRQHARFSYARIVRRLRCGRACTCRCTLLPSRSETCEPSVEPCPYYTRVTNARRFRGVVPPSAYSTPDPTILLWPWWTRRQILIWILINNAKFSVHRSRVHRGGGGGFF